MLLLGILAGIVAGLAAGGRISNLVSVRVRFGALILAALLLRIGTQWLLDEGVAVVDGLRLPLFVLAFGLLAFALWLNRSQPGLLLAMVGVASNGIAIRVNGGYMPVYVPAIDVAGLTMADFSPSFHVALPETLGLDFLLHAGPIGDILPMPVPILANVISTGDVLLATGIAWFLFSSIAHGRSEADEGVVSLWRGRPQRELREEEWEAAIQVGIDRPLVLGGGMGPGFGTAAAASAARAVAIPAGAAIPVPRRPLAERIREHPYVGLARDARFSAFWMAGTISLFGDRLHQIALGVMVFALTGSALQTGLVFLAATLPNLLLGPIAGTFVDRWDQKRVMIVSDLLRAALVLAIPFVVEVEIALVYVLAFVITTVSLFFRPAKAAIAAPHRPP